MAPRKRPKRAVRAVVTSKKVVEETVEVLVTPQGKGQKDKVDLISSSRKEDGHKNVEILPPSPAKSSAVKTIPVQEPEYVPVGGKSPGEPDEDETQPASEPEDFPTPPQKEAPPPTLPQQKKKETKRKRGEGVKMQRRRKRGRPAGEGRGGYKFYLFKVMKQVHPDMGISAKAMTIINNMMSDMFERLAEEAAKLQGHSRRSTMSSREIQGAVKLVLPGELGKHAIAEGTKAVKNYVSYRPK
ncbi:hypothetical protein F511_05240 [Dorcoceras hygrometricum]|uniref:Core Histone H2A/H2B/H3 domain-containing protein n=1 Tax=Dorcoceras hygrometricum TaxID=472368 RepID=A0A2Z7CR10_9LAMI|nr:hypothetical protein F511_05240 [Dorcoceras hygrometricum]